mmetsp:Transcript_29998/g.78555  ORF Transcript_29998/g.78555 Transcript_29998/m.78555 type:complete len:452 (-) Transcript_29998:122-1477(-)
MHELLLSDRRSLESLVGELLAHLLHPLPAESLQALRNVAEVDGAVWQPDWASGLLLGIAGTVLPPQDLQALLGPQGHPRHDRHVDLHAPPLAPRHSNQGVRRDDFHQWGLQGASLASDGVSQHAIPAARTTVDLVGAIAAGRLVTHGCVCVPASPGRIAKDGGTHLVGAAAVGRLLARGGARAPGFCHGGVVWGMALRLVGAAAAGRLLARGGARAAVRPPPVRRVPQDGGVPDSGRGGARILLAARLAPAAAAAVARPRLASRLAGARAERRRSAPAVAAALALRLRRGRGPASAWTGQRRGALELFDAGAQLRDALVEGGDDDALGHASLHELLAGQPHRVEPLLRCPLESGSAPVRGHRGPVRAPQLNGIVAALLQPQRVQGLRPGRAAAAEGARGGTARCQQHRCAPQRGAGQPRPPARLRRSLLPPRLRDACLEQPLVIGFTLCCQ